MPRIQFTLNLDSVPSAPPSRELLRIEETEVMVKVQRVAEAMALGGYDAELPPEISSASAILMGMAQLVAIYRHDPARMKDVLVVLFERAVREAAFGNTMRNAEAVHLTTDKIQ